MNAKLSLKIGNLLSRIFSNSPFPQKKKERKEYKQPPLIAAVFFARVRILVSRGDNLIIGQSPARASPRPAR